MPRLTRTALWILIVLGAFTNSKAQITILGPDTIVLCEPGTVTLEAIYLGLDSTQLVSAEALNNVDDIYSGVINIGFPFTFYGNTYTQCVLSTNGYISFNLAYANGFSPWSIATGIPSAANPLNSIMGPWHDTFPGAWGAPAPGWVTYTTTGTAPNRIFVFNMCMVPMYSCTQQCFSSQIKLFEGSNNIEFHVGHKDLCTTWNQGQAILGVQNATGTLATVVNGYNAGVQWTANNQAWQLTPNGANAYNEQPIPFTPIQVYASTQLQWQQNGLNLGSGNTVTLPANQSGYISVGFAGCFGLGGAASGCGGSSVASGADSVYVYIETLNGSPSRTVSACNHVPDNQLHYIFQNPTGPFTVQWSDSLGNVLQTASNVYGSTTLSDVWPGGYQLVATSPNGCSHDVSYKMPAREMIPSFTYQPNPIICQYQPVLFTSTSTGSITDFNWGFGDGNTGSGAVIAHPYQYFGDSIPVYLAITNDSFPTCLAVDTAFLTIHPNITAAYYASEPACVYYPIGFYDYSYPYPVSWEWHLDGTVVSSDSITYQYFIEAGIHPVTLVVVDSLCGADTLTDFITVYEYPVVDLGNDTLLCPGETIMLDAGNPGMTYQWNTGQITQAINLQITTTTRVMVTVDNNGCTTTDDILVEMNCSLQFPNAFSPNGDGHNDFFLPHLINMETYSMQIYNRWGEVVFTMSNGNGKVTEGWNGTYKNQLAPIGVYTYYATGTTIRGNAVQTMGNVVLMR